MSIGDSESVLRSKIQRISERHSETKNSPHIISPEIGNNLLRIYTKYDDNHKCLCTSRFRHALHQLQGEPRCTLVQMCKELHQICEDTDGITSGELASEFLNDVFDVSDLGKRFYSSNGRQNEAEKDLSVVLSRLISEYRAIFAIEEDKTVIRTDEECQKLRKRHEEEDDCPEEIKLMKVDLDELSLNCSSASTSVNQTFVKSGNSDSFINRYYDLCRKVSTGHKEDPLPSEPITWQAAALSQESNTKFPWSMETGSPGIRKRKEDFSCETPSSIVQQEKKIHRQREESIVQESDKNEEEKKSLNDLHRQRILQESQMRNKVENKQDEEGEISSDSSSSSSTGASSHHDPMRKSRKIRKNSMKENDDDNNNMPISPASFWNLDDDPIKDRNSSRLSPVWPSHSESEEEKSRFNVLSHMDPSHSTKITRRSPDSSRRRIQIKELGRQLNNSKKKLEEMELEFETLRGYRPSQVEKHSDEFMKKLLVDQINLKKRIRQIKDHQEENSKSLRQTSSTQLPLKEQALAVATPSLINNDNNNTSHKDLASIYELVCSLTNELKLKRKTHERPIEFEDMTEDQLVDEKVDLFNALKRIEDSFGKLESDEEKDIIKELSDRYMSIKRRVRKSSTIRSKDTSYQLETIPENEEIPLTLASPQHRMNVQLKDEDLYGNLNLPENSEEDDGVSISCSSSRSESPEWGEEYQASSEKLQEKKLHSLSRYELIQVYNKVKDEKKHYKRVIREWEEQMRIETGRKLSKEERDSSPNGVYQLYKKARSKFRLVEALLSKGQK